MSDDITPRLRPRGSGPVATAAGVSVGLPPTQV